MYIEVMRQSFESFVELHWLVVLNSQPALVTP